MAIDAGYGDTVGCVQVNVHHACHVDIELVGQKVLKVAEKLQVADIGRFDARHDHVQAEALQLAAAVEESLLH